MKTNSIAIQLTNVTKTYTLHHEKPTFVENMIRRSRSEQFTALDNVSLTIKQGEKVGIIGPNGAGKTTLLKIIAGITTPDSGQVITNGKVVSLIDLSAGFHPDLTGEENIFLNGMVIGMSRHEINAKFKQIVEFADIGGFIDAPMFTYSEGMKLRLGFSVAVHAEPDILLLDEGMAVGDEEFRRKSMMTTNLLFQKNKTIVISSHWLEYLYKQTKKIMELDNHQIKHHMR